MLQRVYMILNSRQESVRSRCVGDVMRQSIPNMLWFSLKKAVGICFRKRHPDSASVFVPGGVYALNAT